MTEEESADDRDSPRARLLAAAVACIEEHGVSAVTTRLIAAKAGLNGAAVNYYFGGKDQLVEQALDLTRREGFVHPLIDFDRLVGEGASPGAALRSVLGQMLSDSIHYPKVTFAHLRGAIEHQRYDGVSVRQLNQFLSELDQRLEQGSRAAASPERRAARRARLAQIWAVVGLNAMAPLLFTPFTGLDLTRDADRELFLEQLLAGLPLE